MYRAYDVINVPEDSTDVDFATAERNDRQNSGRMRSMAASSSLAGRQPETIVTDAPRDGRVTINEVIYERQYQRKRSPGLLWSGRIVPGFARAQRGYSSTSASYWHMAAVRGTATSRQMLRAQRTRRGHAATEESDPNGRCRGSVCQILERPLGWPGIAWSLPHLASRVSATSENAYHSRQFGFHLGVALKATPSNFRFDAAGWGTGRIRVCFFHA